MKAIRGAWCAAWAAGLLLAGTGPGWAQDFPPAQGRVIAVPPGAVLIVLPAGAPPAAEPLAAEMPGFPAMPSPLAMLREMDAMMAAAEHAAAMPARGAGVSGAGVSGAGVSGVIVTSVSDGRGTCTQRIEYRADGAAPVVQVSGSGAGCAGVPGGAPAGTAQPVARPQARPDAPPPARLIETRAAPLQFAQAAD